MKTGASGLVGAVLAAIAGAAHAQVMDYGSLQQLFGEPVTTSVTGSPQRVSDVPATMEIITADDIRRSGAIDVPGVLRHVAGVDVLQWGTDQADVTIRGYNQVYSPRLLVMIDGRQVYADYYGYTPWSTLPVELSAIRQIEVVKGPNSALFGFNAAGGVINIVTFNPLYDNVNTASVTGGTQGLIMGSGVGMFKLGDLGAIRLMVGGRRNNEFSTPASPAFSSLRRESDRGSVDATAVLRLDEKVTLELGANHVTADQSEVTAGMIPGFVRYNTNSVRGRLTADTSSGLWQLTAYSNWINTAYNFNNVIVPFPPLNFSNNVTVVQLQDSLKVGANHTLRGTVEYRHNTVGTTPSTGGNVYYDVVAAGGMWQWQIQPSLTLTNALRVDHLMLGRNGSMPAGSPFTNADWNNRRVTTLSFNSGLVWKATADDTLRLLVGRGVQLPNLAALGALQVRTPYPYSGVPYLNPTIVTNYELGWEHRFPSIATTLRVGAYHQVSEQIASLSGGFVMGPTGIPFFASANVMNSVADGLEIELKGKFRTDWRWGLSYTPEIVTDYFFAGQTILSTLTNFQSGTPVHTVKANVGWSHGPWEVDAFLRYKSYFLGFTPVSVGGTPTLTPINDYFSMDARVAYQLTERVTLAVSGQNISQAYQRQTSGANVERRVFGTLSVKF